MLIGKVTRQTGRQMELFKIMNKYDYPCWSQPEQLMRCTNQYLKSNKNKSITELETDPRDAVMVQSSVENIAMYAYRTEQRGNVTLTVIQQKYKLSRNN
jgi:hypothetical protein